MTTVTPSDQAGAASAKRPATIPTQRSGQVLRLLVLGAGEDAAAFRARAAEAGAELAQRFSVRVTHVVVEEGVGEDDARVVRARGAGLPVLGLVEGARLVEEEGASRTSEAAVEVGEEEEAADAGASEVGIGVGVGVEVEVEAEAEVEAAGAGASVDGVDRVDAVPLIRPRAEVVPEPVDGGPSDVFAGSALEAMLQFPPLPAEEFEGGDSEADVDAELDAEAGKRTGVGAEMGIGTAAGARAETARMVDGAVGDEAPSVLMDVASAACACAETGAETTGTEWGEASDRAGVAGEPLRGATLDGAARLGGATQLEGEALLKLAAARGEWTAAGRASSIAWALVPLVSLGLLTPVAIGYAAYRLRSRGLAAATACYTVAIVAAFAVSAVLPVHTRAQSIIGDLMTTCLAASWLGGTAHSFMLRRRVFGLSK